MKKWESKKKTNISSVTKLWWDFSHFATYGLLLFVFGCSGSSTSQDSTKPFTETVRGAVVLVSSATQLLVALKAAIESADFQALTPEEQSNKISQIISNFPSDTENLKKTLSEAILAAEKRASPDLVTKLKSIFQELYGTQSYSVRSRGALNIGNNAMSSLLSALQNFTLGQLPTLLNQITNLLALLQQLSLDLQQITDLLLNQTAQPGVGQVILWGPTLCPTITNHFPLGYVPDYAERERFGQLMTCMENDKRKECAARCANINTEFFTCSATAAAVTKVLCIDSQLAPELRAVCNQLPRPYAYVTETDGTWGKFPAGYYYCSNDAAHPKQSPNSSIAPTPTVTP